jgi:putative hydrolase
MPFFGDLARLFGQKGGVPWDTARSLALAVATDGESEPNVDPGERIKLEQLARAAELHVARVTGLETSVGGHEVQVMPVNRALWASKTLEAFRPLLESLATSLAPAPEADVDSATTTGSDLEPNDPLDPAGDELEDQMAAMIGPMLQAMQPTMVAMTAGSMVGHLAQRCFGQYDLPIPRPAGAHELLVVMPNLDAFSEEWSLPPDDLRLWVCLQDITYHTVMGVPHVRARMDELIGKYVTSFRNDPRSLQDQLQGLADPTDMDPTGANLMAQIQQVLGEPGALLGAIESDEQRDLRPQLEALVAALVGVVDHVMDQVGTTLIGSYGMMTEALRRRRVQTSEADRFVERLFGLELTQATYDRGSAFVEGVIERAGEAGLARLWESETMLPSPPEVDAPGLWLARIDLPDAE